MCPTTPSSINSRLNETSASFDRFHRFAGLAQMDLADLRRSFEDTNASIERFNTILNLPTRSKDDVSSAKETASVKENSEQTLVKSERKRQDDQLESTLKIATLLRAAGSDAGESFLSAISKSMQILRQIINLTGSSDSASGLSGISPLFSGFASLLSFFDKGGYTGDIAGSKAAGIVHGGEIVFEKPLVDANRDQLMSLRRALQQGNSFNDIFKGIGGSSQNYSVNDLSPLIAELRLLRSENKQLTSAVQGLEIQTPVVLEGTLSGQQFLRKEMPAFESYNAKKKI